jgi:hypothetical protein
MSQRGFMSVYIRQSHHLSLQAIVENTFKIIQLFSSVDFFLRKAIA